MSTHILSRILSASFGIVFIASSNLPAQQAGTGQAGAQHPAAAAVFTTDAVTRTAKAVDYKSQGGKTKLVFDGTALAKSASGEATVESKSSAAEIEAKFERLPDPQRFGVEYLTYVLWAIAPEGRLVNLGELRREKMGEAKLTATSELHAFGMVLTAEPYYAVRTPSDVIIAEGELAKREKDDAFIDAKYELLKRGAYQKLADPLGLSLDLKSTPLDIYQARNALAIAVSVGANEHALDALKRAEASLEMTNSPMMAKGRKKERIALARSAVQFAEDARAQTVELITKKRALESAAGSEQAK